MLKRSPNADVKQKLRDLNDDWQMLASAARRKRENIDAIHKALDDFESVMDGARQTLDGVAGEIEEFKKVCHKFKEQMCNSTLKCSQKLKF